MTKFDKMLEEMNKKSRTLTKKERYPKNINLSSEFLDMLSDEYKEALATGNRTVHSNFLKAISFEIDVLRERIKGDDDALDIELDGIMDAIDSMAKVESGIEGDIIEVEAEI